MESRGLEVEAMKVDAAAMVSSEGERERSGARFASSCCSVVLGVCWRWRNLEGWKGREEMKCLATLLSFSLPQIIAGYLFIYLFP